MIVAFTLFFRLFLILLFPFMLSTQAIQSCNMSFHHHTFDFLEKGEGYVSDFALCLSDLEVPVGDQLQEYKDTVMGGKTATSQIIPTSMSLFLRGFQEFRMRSPAFKVSHKLQFHRCISWFKMLVTTGGRIIKKEMKLHGRLNGTV